MECDSGKQASCMLRPTLWVALHISLQSGIRNIRSFLQTIFQPVAFENHRSLNSSGFDFLCEVGRRVSASSGDARETSDLFQRLSISIQRFNSVLILESFTFDNEDPDL